MPCPTCKHRDICKAKEPMMKYREETGKASKKLKEKLKTLGIKESWSGSFRCDVKYIMDEKYGENY